MLAGLPIAALLWAGLTFAEPCEQAAHIRDLHLAIEQAHAAYGTADLPAFHDALRDLEQLLPCTAEPISRTLAAQIHRTHGLHHFVERNEDASRRAFAAARAIEPGYVLPADIVPAGNPVHTLYGAMAVDNPMLDSVPAPQEGHLRFDGREATERPLSWPTVLQRFDPLGKVVDTWHLLPDDPMPPYDAVHTRSDGTTTPGTLDRRPRIRGELLVGAGIAAALSGVSWTMASRSRALYEDPTTGGRAVLDHLRAQSNGLTIASVGLGSTAVAAGAGAFLLARW